jgi:predicted methyltransferase
MKTNSHPFPVARRRTILTLPFALALASCASAATPSATLQQAIASPLREPKARARDAYRHPAETLQFFKLSPDQTVIEIDPGAGWYTDILAPYLRATGTLYEAQYLEPGSKGNDGEAGMRAAFEKKLAATPSVYGEVKVGTLQAGNFDGFGGSLQGKADRVLTFRNIHNWMEDGQLEANLRAFYAALKPGGMLGVEEHRAVPGTPLQKMIDTGYVTEAYVINRVSAAGFLLDGKSEINSNPRDTKDYPNGVWSLPPTYRGGDTDRARFAAIGESDRMTLRFIKRQA